LGACPERDHGIVARWLLVKNSKALYLGHSVLIFLNEIPSLSLSKLITRTVIKYLKGLEKR